MRRPCEIQKVMDLFLKLCFYGFRISQDEYVAVILCSF